MQCDALTAFLRAVLGTGAAVLLALSLLWGLDARAGTPTTDLSVSEAEGLRRQLEEEGWLGGYKDKLVHVFLAETFVESRNKCLNYVINVSARYMSDLWEIELATAIFFTKGNIVAVIPERDNMGFVMTFLCRRNGYAVFSSGVSSEAFKGLLP